MSYLWLYQHCGGVPLIFSFELQKTLYELLVNLQHAGE